MKHLLVHSGEWLESAIETEEYPEVVTHTLDRIRIAVDSKRLSLSSQGAQPVASATLFFLPSFSKVDGEIKELTAKEGDIIRFDSYEWHITGINPVYDSQQKHHIEVTLV